MILSGRLTFEGEKINIMDTFHHPPPLLPKQNGGDLKGAMKDLLSEADRLEIRDKAPLVFCDRIFNSKILNQIKEHRVLLLRYQNLYLTLFVCLKSIDVAFSVLISKIARLGGLSGQTPQFYN